MAKMDQISNKFSLKNVEADGNCGYRSLSVLIFGTEKYHWLLRRALLQWRQQQGEAEGVKKWDAIKNEMTERKTERELWLNAQDMTAFANKFHVNVLLFTSQNVDTPRWKCYSPGSTRDGEQRFGYGSLCLYLHGNHFQAITSFS